MEFTLPQLTDNAAYFAAVEERESIASAMETLKEETTAKSHQASELKKRIVTI